MSEYTKRLVTDRQFERDAQGGKLQIGAPTGNWLMVVVYRGKHDPVRP